MKVLRIVFWLNLGFKSAAELANNLHVVFKRKMVRIYGSLKVIFNQI